MQSPITISAEHFHTIARQLVSQCSSQVYVLVAQPGLHVTDFTATTVPYLRQVVKNAELRITASYDHGQVDLEDISLLAKGLKCLTESTFVDARHIRPLLLTLIVDATFPAFVEINQTCVLIIEFEELPLYFSHRKSHLTTIVISSLRL